jgi:large-conductance mechanosensitive channel
MDGYHFPSMIFQVFNFIILFTIIFFIIRYLLNASKQRKEMNRRLQAIEEKLDDINHL